MIIYSEGRRTTKDIRRDKDPQSREFLSISWEKETTFGMHCTGTPCNGSLDAIKFENFGKISASQHMSHLFSDVFLLTHNTFGQFPELKYGSTLTSSSHYSLRMNSPI